MTTNATRSVASCVICVCLSSLLAPPVLGQATAVSGQRLIAQSDCKAERLGTSIPPASIGEPVSSVTVDPPVWHEASTSVPAHCMATGSMAPVDRSPTAQPIQFGVALPASWNLLAMHMGGSGMNGRLPGLTGNSVIRQGGPSELLAGFATYGSDSGHSNDPNWAVNDEAIRNLAYMQMKKTHDAAMVLIERMYGVKPRLNYFVGGSQGGREALTVAQRYPADYDGISARVPAVDFTGLMLAPAWIRIREKRLANWVPTAKGKAIATEFMRQCDRLDGLVDGVINNYAACRAIFNVNSGKPGRDPWAAKRCHDGVDPNPADASATACLTDGQIETLKLAFSSYKYQTPPANDVRTFGMWAPTTDIDGGDRTLPPGAPPADFLTDQRFKGQEGAAPDAPVYRKIGALGITGFILKNLSANPLDYEEGGEHHARRMEISAWLDATDPDLSAFRKRGGKLLVVIGTNDTVAAPGAQLDYYQSVLERMGREAVDGFARFYVLPQTGHRLSGSSYTIDGDGKIIPASEIPASFDNLGLLRNWVENGVAPNKAEIVTGSNGRSRPMCSYPQYPKYLRGDPLLASSYSCTD